jgi:polysaccharide export outer membrane protein
MCCYEKGTDTMLQNRREIAEAPLLEARDVASVLRSIATVAASCASSLVLALSAMALSGCGLAPGMSFSQQAGGAGGAQYGGASQAIGDAKGLSGSGSDAAPPGSMIEINAGLIDSTRPPVDPGIPEKVRALFAKQEPYTLGSGDVLSIVVWNHPELNLPAEPAANTSSDASGSTSIAGGYTVDSSGNVQFAIVGSVHMAGLTEMGASELLAQKLSNVIRDPRVTLRIQAYRSRRVYVDGEVRNPGIAIINDVPMTLPEAINRAGGFTTNGDRAAVAVTRNDDTVMVNMADMIAAGVNPDKILLRDGDLVRVYSINDRKVFILGEVEHTMAVPLNNGHLTLNEALGSAGGVSQHSGDASQIYVVRNKSRGKPQVFHLDGRSPLAMALANDFELKSNDVVFVDASPLVRWSRVINMVLPSGGLPGIPGAAY